MLSASSSQSQEAEEEEEEEEEEEPESPKDKKDKKKPADSNNNNKAEEPKEKKKKHVVKVSPELSAIVHLPSTAFKVSNPYPSSIFRRIYPLSLFLSNQHLYLSIYSNVSLFLSLGI